LTPDGHLALKMGCQIIWRHNDSGVIIIGSWNLR
jgi:hypothetical protein